MKKWIVLITGTVCVLSSLTADPAALPEIVAATETVGEQAPKQVGKASADAANTAKSSNVAKYVLAGGAVAIGVTALILISRHHGHHHHHNAHSK